MSRLRIRSLLGNSQRLDGGAMFGNAPKALWQRWVDVDQENRIELVCRALLVETASTRILFETGIGAFFSPEWRQRYGVQEASHVLLENLGRLGFCDADIGVVVLSHLHFDHAGGLLSSHQAEIPPRLLFPNARFLVGEQAWRRACAPHARDRASFIETLPGLLQQSGRLELLAAGDGRSFEDLHLSFFASEGHTPGMLCSDLRWPGGRLVFAADLIPGTPWVHLPITMGYDRFPERLIEEKSALLTTLAADGGWLFFTHDPRWAMGQVLYDGPKQRFSPAALQETTDLVWP
jgi:glyoxylase-like metal-dependent hydrolase (beta-lactamase superfamily II)